MLDEGRNHDWFNSPEIAILAGATTPLAVTGAEDEFYNPVPPPLGRVAWHVAPNVGAIDDTGRLTIRLSHSDHRPGRAGRTTLISCVWP